MNKFLLLVFICSCSVSDPAGKTDAVKKEVKQETKKQIGKYSEITCPECNYTTTELLPEDYCLLKYQCKKCKTELFPAEGDCCVFCTYGDVKCPSMQEE